MNQATSPLTTNLESRDNEGDIHLVLSQSATTKNHPSSPGWPSSGELDGRDSAWPLFSMYCKIAEEEDNKMIERYQREADGILIFASIFTAAVSASVTVSFQDLRSNPQDTSVFYLKAIHQILANPNTSQVSMSSALVTPPAFSPPAYAIWTNSLWFLSMASSLLSAMLAMLLRQWARRYVMVIQQPWLTPEQRARVRQTFTNYPHKSNVRWVTIPMHFFLCLSIVLYVTGGLVFLSNINHIVFRWGVLCAGHGAGVYVAYTAASIFRPEILWYTPFSPLVLDICLRVWDIVLRVSSCLPPFRRYCDNSERGLRELNLRYHQGLLEGKCMAVKEAASKRSSEIDLNILEWLFRSLVEDPVLEQFLGAIPGFFDSKLVHNIQGHLSDGFQIEFRRALNSFLDHTFSSKTFTESVRGDRLVICLNAALAALGPGAVSQILGSIFDGRWPAALQSIEVGHALKHWNHTGFSSYIRKIVARIVSRVQVRERDDRWIMLVQAEFGISGRALQGHVTPGDGISLALLIHITRQFLRTDSPPWDPDILRGFSNFDVHNTLPGQQHDFCAAWNEVVREAQNRGPGSTPVSVLKEIWYVYAALHRDASDIAPASCSTTRDEDALLDPLSYPFCRVVDHRLDSTMDTHFNKGQAEDPSHTHSPHEVPDATRLPQATPIPTPSRPVSPEDRSAAVAKISLISRTANVIPFPSSPPTPMPTPTSMLSLISSSSGPHSVFSAAVDTLVTRSNYAIPIPGTPLPSSDASRLFIPPHVSTSLNQSATLGIGGAGTPNDTRDPNLPTTREVYRRPCKSAPSAPNMSANITRRDSDGQTTNSLCVG